MRHLAAEDIIRELSYTGRIFSGEEAKDYGFVTHLAEDPVQKALALAKEIVARSPDAVRAAKSIYNQVGDTQLAEILLAETHLQKSLIGSSNQMEAIIAGLQKRPATFKD